MSARIPAHSTVKFKIVALVSLALLSLAAMALWQTRSLRDLNLDDEREKVAGVAQATAAMVSAIAAADPSDAGKAAAIAAVKPLRYGDGEYVFILDKDGHEVMNPIKPELDGKDMIDVKDPSGYELFKGMIQAARAPEGGFVSYLWPKPGQDTPVPKVSYVKAVPAWGWIIGTGVYLDKLDAQMSQRYLAIAAALLAAVAGFGAIGWLAVASVSGPIAKAISAAHEMAEGDMRQAPHGVSGELGSLLDAIEQTKSRIGALAGGIQTHATSISTSSAAMEAACLSASKSSEMQSKSLTEVASATAQISSGAKTMAEASGDAAAKARRSAELSRRTLEGFQDIQAELASIRSGVGESSSIVDGLREQSATITRVAADITGIAAQTNMLALNAAIEAARAGEQGRGFAVVADEVRTLAERTAEMASRISSTVSAIGSQTALAVDSLRSATERADGGLATAERAKGALSDGIAAVDEGLAALEVIRDALRGQDAGMQRIAESIGAIADGAKEGTLSASESHRVAHDTAQELALVAERLSSECRKFKT